MMQLSMPKKDLVDLVHRQVSSFFPSSDEERNAIATNLETALNRLDVCLRSRINGYMNDLNGGGRFV